MAKLRIPKIQTNPETIFRCILAYTDLREWYIKYNKCAGLQHNIKTVPYGTIRNEIERLRATLAPTTIS